MAAPVETLPAPPAPRLHYAWIVVAVTFLVLLIGAGVRATRRAARTNDMGQA